MDHASLCVDARVVGRRGRRRWFRWIVVICCSGGGSGRLRIVVEVVRSFRRQDSGFLGWWWPKFYIEGIGRVSVGIRACWADGLAEWLHVSTMVVSFDR